MIKDFLELFVKKTFVIFPMKMHCCLSLILFGSLTNVLSTKYDGRNRIKSEILSIPRLLNFSSVAFPIPGNVVRSLSFNLMFKN